MNFFLNSKWKIFLLTEDEKLHQNIRASLFVANSFINHPGFDLFSLPNFDELNKVLDDHKPDVIFWHLVRPETQDFEKLQAQIEPLRDMPIIVVSKTESLEYIRQQSLEGVQDYLTEENTNAALLLVSIMRSKEMISSHRELMEVKDQFEEVQQLGKIGFWEYDIQSHAINWSDEMFTLFERDPKLGPPANFKEVSDLYPEHAQNLEKNGDQAIENGQRIDFEDRITLPSGKQVYYAATMQPVKNTATGKVAKLFGTTQDITDRKLIEEAHKRRLAELEVLYESSLCFNQLQEPKKIAHKLIEFLEKKLSWHHAAIRQYHADTNQLELLAISKEYEQKAQVERLDHLISSIDRGLSGWVIKNVNF